MALGLANAIDYIADIDSALLQQAIDDLSITTQDLHYRPHLNDERAVLATIVQAIAEGQGGERYVDEPSVLDTLALRFPYTVSLGGTATRAANLLAAHSISSLVHMLSYTEEDRTLIDPLVEVVVAPSSPQSSFHLIIQYQSGLTVQVADRTITAPTANRIILNNNPAIRAVELNPLFFSQAGDCDLLLISGLNAMHSQSLLETRLAELSHYLEPMPPSLSIVYESGCFHKAQFVDLVRKALCPYLTVYSMNEEEWSDLVGSDMRGADADDVRTALAETSALLSVPIVVIHTKHYVVARGKDAATYKSALQQGIDWAIEAMLDGKSLPGSLSPYGVALHEALEDNLTCCVPCRRVNAPTMATIGLGDAFIAGFLSKIPTRRSNP